MCVDAFAFSPAAGSTESTVPSASSDFTAWYSTLANSSASNRAAASSLVAPTTEGTVRATDTWMTTSVPASLREPADGSVSSTLPSTSSDFTCVHRTANPLRSSS